MSEYKKRRGMSAMNPALINGIAVGLIAGLVCRVVMVLMMLTNS